MDLECVSVHLGLGHHGVAQVTHDQPGVIHHLVFAVQLSQRLEEGGVGDTCGKKRQN